MARSVVGDLRCRPRGVARGEAEQMLGLEEDERGRLRLQVALLRLHHQELDVLAVAARERLGYQPGDVLVLETLDAGAVHLQDQLPDLQAAGAVGRAVLLKFGYKFGVEPLAEALKCLNEIK